VHGGQEAAVPEAAVGQEKTMRLRLKKEPVRREKTLRLRLRKEAKVGREKTLRLRLRKRLRQEPPVAEAAEAQETVVNLEAAVNYNAPNTNTSYESLLKWGENLEPADGNSNGTDMEVDFHINQLAAACDSVSWNVEEKNVKMDGSEETVESVEKEIQSDSHTIVDMVLDDIVELAMCSGGFDDPIDANDTLHDSSLWEVEDAHVQEEAVVDQPVEVEVEEVVAMVAVDEAAEVEVEEVVAMVAVDRTAEVEVEDVEQLGNVVPPRRSERLRFKLNRNNL